MALFNQDHQDKIADAVKQTDSFEDTFKNNILDIPPEKKLEKKKTGRPPKDPRERKKSYQLSMTEILMKRIEYQRDLMAPNLSRSAFICELLEHSLNQMKEQK